jgi:hypothetical protein
MKDVKDTWYGIFWKHAGGCDTEFQMKWEPENKLRVPTFSVIHLGNPAVNWHGRSSDYLDGTKNKDAPVFNYWQQEMLEKRKNPNYNFLDEFMRR